MIIDESDGKQVVFNEMLDHVNWEANRDVQVERDVHGVPKEIVAKTPFFFSLAGVIRKGE